MPITYPLTPPAAFKSAKLVFAARRASSAVESPFTLHAQRFHHPGERFDVAVSCPPMKRASAEEVIGWLLAAGRGTVWLGDYANPAPRGSVTGTITVGSGAAANSMTLPLSGATGTFAVGDWLQVGGALHKVIFVDSATSVQVFPRLRSAYTAGTAVVYNSARGLFRLADSSLSWEVDVAMNYGLDLAFVEAVGASPTPVTAT
jgi:hypothetical protein